MDKDLPYYLGFSYFLGIGPMKLRALLDKFKSVKDAYLADINELKDVIGIKLSERFCQFRARFDPDREIGRISRDGIAVLSIADRKYPYVLKNIPDPPICLFIKGKLSLDDFFLSVVGTRAPTSYGEEMTRIFVQGLSSAGITVVSGMAYGIDAVAHHSAIAAGGKTVAVLGCGINIVYPASHISLYDRIIKTGGAIVSEFPPNQSVVKGMFIARNRIISGLSRGVLVVEGGKNSGTLITARYGAEQGRDIFAVPGQVTNSMSQAPNLLIKNGAKLVMKPDDILEEYGFETGRGDIDSDEKLTELQTSINAALIIKPLTIDELIVRLKIQPTIILNNISILELKGVVFKNKQGKYEVKRY